MSYFRTTTAFARAMDDSRPSIAVVTGGSRGIGLAIATRIASFPFIDKVLAISQSIQQSDVDNVSSKILAIRADIGSEDGRQCVVEHVTKLCAGTSNPNKRQKQLRFLVHAAGIIDPIKSVLHVTPEEFRRAMTVNVEGPFFLTTALYPFMTPIEEEGREAGIAGRVLHVSSGAAHGAPLVGWGCYGISKAAFFQSYRVMEREFREAGGGAAHVVVGSFKPGVVDTDMQRSTRQSSPKDMPSVGNFQTLKDNASNTTTMTRARPPPTGALDTPVNVAFFAEYLLVGTTDEEFANKDDPNEFDIRNKELFPHWIAPEDLPDGPW